ncbi:hypothetical protein HYE67_009389 [Fusarium culmorum]|uniref:Methyltransferase domain-containing protein n=1 Tax=Fusarium culmorum TaxID=5516 RepID=A0A2T4H8R1_FUSCU|nr:hypothetical protein FCULG_00004119 [Fusarium culmorum]QPC67158.1 hypothetical protein HYE67_009389 [Fusarium culmorum]
MVPAVTKIAHNVRYQHLKVLRNLGEFKSIRFEQSPTSYRSVLHSEIPYITMTSSIATAGASSAIASLAIKSDFATVARKNGVDETTIGDYDLVVKEYIHPPQNSPFRILEVGMGCRQTPAIKNLYRTWQEYLPTSCELFSIESNSACTDLGAVEAAQLEGKFDITIDSGFHTLEYQIQALKAFWKQVSPGGVYVLMSTTPPTSKGLYTLLTNVASTPPKESISSELKIIHCGERFCVLTKGLSEDEFSYLGLGWE